jgi:type I restriction enzyme, S subunit
MTLTTDNILLSSRDSKRWVFTEIKNIGIIKSGGTPKTTKREYWENGTIPWINSGKLKDGIIDEPSKYITKEGLQNSAAKLFPKYTVVIALTGATTGRVGLLSFPCCTNQSVTGIFPSTIYDSKYLFYYLIHSRTKFIHQAIGSAQHHINQRIVENFVIPLAPLNEQKRIVTKIDELFSIIDNANNIVKKIKQQLPKLLQKIIDDFTSYDASKSQVFKLGEIANIKGGVTLGRRLNGKTIKIPYLRVANVQDGFLDLREIKEIKVLESEKEKWILESGDILLTEGGDRDKLGRGTVWRRQIPTCIHQNHIFRVRLDKKLFDPDFLSLILRSSRSKKYFSRIGKQTVNLASINKTQLSSLEFSCPDIKMQKLLLDKILRNIDYLNDFKKTADEIEKKLLTLEDQILSYAFQGKLGPQDPIDEPVKIPLQKIKQEKEKMQENKKVIKVRPTKQRRIKNAK